MNKSHLLPSLPERASRLRRAIGALCWLTAILPFTGSMLTSCDDQSSTTSAPDEDPASTTASAVTITSVDPETEEAPGASGHTIRLNRAEFGIDAFPSNNNEAAGTSFTAPCGCIDLTMDGGQVGRRRYRKGDTKVSFPGTVALGKHTYQASYSPWNDAAKCVDLYFDCPPPPAPYTSGVLTVEAVKESTPAPSASGKFADRAPGTPAWCDLKHHLHKKMTAKHPTKCGGASQANFCESKDKGWWCDATRSGIVFCEGGKVATDKKHATRPCACVERYHANDECADGEETTVTHEAATLVRGELEIEGGNQIPYAIVFVDLKASSIRFQTYVGELEDGSLLPNSAPDPVSHASTPTEDTNPGIPRFGKLTQLKNVSNPIAAINTTPWAPNDAIIFSGLWDRPPWWPTRTLEANGLWYRWGANDTKILLRQGEAKLLYEGAPSSLAAGWDHAFGSTIPLVFGAEKAAEIKDAKKRDKRSALGIAGKGRYLVLFASNNDEGLTTFEVASLLQATRSIGGKPVQTEYAILLDGGHATQIYAPHFILSEQWDILAGFAVLPNP